MSHGCEVCDEAWMKKHPDDQWSVVFECGHIHTLTPSKFLIDFCRDIPRDPPDCGEEYYRFESRTDRAVSDVLFKCGHGYSLVDGSKIGSCTRPLQPELTTNCLPDDYLGPNVNVWHRIHTL